MKEDAISKKKQYIEKDCYFKNKKQNKNEVANKVALLTKWLIKWYE